MGKKFGEIFTAVLKKKHFALKALSLNSLGVNNFEI